MTEERGTIEEPQTLTELFTLAQENLKKKGIKRTLPSASNYLASSQANRRLLDSMFIKPRFLDPVEPDTGLVLFGVKMKTPAFCSALSKPNYMSDAEMTDLVRGIGNTGSMMMLGIGDSKILQSAIDTDTPVVKIVKPYRNTELIYQKVRDAESRGCVAVGIDIDHFYGMYSDGKSDRAEIFAPKQIDEIRQAMSFTKLPFILKGVLSKTTTERAIEIGASAIVVSNHGVSSLDFGEPAVVALPNVVKTAGDKLIVLVDTGFRTGNDIFKGLALGAQGVGFATSVLMAASASGAESVEQFIGFVTAELKRTMAICGCSDLSAVNRSLLTTSPELTPWW